MSGKTFVTNSKIQKATMNCCIRTTEETTHSATTTHNFVYWKWRRILYTDYMYMCNHCLHSHGAGTHVYKTDGHRFARSFGLAVAVCDEAVLCSLSVFEVSDEGARHALRSDISTFSVSIKFDGRPTTRTEGELSCNAHTQHAARSTRPGETATH